MKSNLKEIEDRLRKTTPGEWEIDVYSSPVGFTDCIKYEYFITSPKVKNESYPGRNGIVAHFEGMGKDRKPLLDGDVDLIIHAPEDLRSLLEDVWEAKRIFGKMLNSGAATIWEFEEEIRQFLKESRAMRSKIPEIEDQLEKYRNSDHLFSLDEFYGEVLPWFDETIRDLLADVKEAKELARDIERFERCQIGLKRLAKRANQFLKEKK